MMSAVSGLPIVLDVAERCCVVVGGGAVGSRKATALADAGAAVTVIDPAEPATAQAGIDLEQRAWRAGDAAGSFLVVVATDDDAVNAAAAADARAAGALVLRADQPADGDLRMVSAADVAGVRVSVDSGGTSPALAAVVRREIQRMFDDDAEVWSQFLAWCVEQHPVTIDVARTHLEQLRATQRASVQHDSNSGSDR